MNRKFGPLCLLAVVAPYLFGCEGQEGREDSHLERGQSYIAAAQYDKAQVELRNVLQINPSNSKALCLLGDVYQREEDWNKAFAQFKRAVELAPHNLEARTRLGKIYLLFGDTAHAKEQSDFVLAKAPEDPAGRTLKFAISARSGDIQGARDGARTVLEKHPSDENAASTLAGILVKLGEYEKAAQVLTETLKQAPKSVMLRLNLVDLLARQKRHESIEPLLTELVAIEPAVFAHYHRLAAFYANSNRKASAEKVLRNAIAANSEDEQRYLALAQLIADQLDAGQAEQELQRAIRKLPRATKIRLGLAELYERMGRPEKAEEVYRETIEFLRSGPERLTVQSRLAKLLLLSGDLSESKEMISNILKASPHESEALLTRGRLALERNDPQSAISDFRAALLEQPGSIEALTRLAQAHLLNHEQGLAQQSLAKAVELNPTHLAARLTLMDFLSRSGDFDGALRELNELLWSSPSDTILAQRKSMLLSSKKDPREADETIANLRAAMPDQVVGYCQMGSYYLAERRLGEAAAEFETALRKEPNASGPLLGLVQTYLAQGRADKATARLQEVLRGLPQHTTAHVLLAQAFDVQRKDVEAEQAYKDAIALRPKWRIPYVALADFYLKRKDAASAIGTLKAWLKEDPDDAAARTSLAQLHEDLGGSDRAAASPAANRE